MKSPLKDMENVLRDFHDDHGKLKRDVHGNYLSESETS